MDMIIKLLVGFIALEHLGFLYLEMFLWDTPKGRKIFKTDDDFANASKALAANQGLYNGFLAAGLIWSLLQPESDFAHQLQVFFVTCVAIAGIYGWRTVSSTILYVQALPALFTLLLLVFA